MGVYVKDYIDFFCENKYPFLLDNRDIDKLFLVKEKYGDIETKESILEFSLTEKEKKCDYSIRVDVESEYTKEYWYELDSSAVTDTDIMPCYFIDASKVVPGADNTDFFQKVLVKMTGRERMDRLDRMLCHCIDKLQGKCKCLFQLGVMTARSENDSIRLFTDDMSRENILQYLSELNWTGNINALNQCLTKWEKYSDKGSFIIDFDIFSDCISSRIGINFGTKSKSPKFVAEFLDALEKEGLCLPDKKEDVLKFINVFPCHTPFIQNDISHFKLPFDGNKVLRAKAYLRQGTDCYYTGFRAYYSPVLMNLELTTRCPLRCPQCYCDLERGIDMELSTAMYWIEEAYKNNVKVVNLSGGETMVYPHLMELIKACYDRGMEANVALSGYGASKEVLNQMIANGVADICVSLNGSTETINSYSRDGYKLAINLLELLAEIGYARVCINWVMHSNNADDFEEIIKIAEKYKVKHIAVMQFKPDSSHQLPSLPEKDQVLKLAKIIKSYNGEIIIEAEECFSQLRALLGRSFFGNRNRGVSRGCGAGRDGVSVSVTGKLTPCRHIEVEEEFDSLKEYWHQSKTLSKLRNVEDNMEAPCNGCEYNRYCIPCMAVNLKLKGNIFMGEETCVIRPD